LKILLIEDEPKIAEFVIKGLNAALIDVMHVEDGEKGLALILQGGHDLAILDLMLPKLNGFEVLQQAKAAASSMPIIILSAKVDLNDRLKGFEMGADDYLPKPFFVEELLARIKLVAKRHKTEEVREISVGPLSLDVVTHQAKWFHSIAKPARIQFAGVPDAIAGSHLLTPANSQTCVGNSFRSRNQLGRCMCAPHQAKA
jgi:DNA-binding response OmpR family regulator